MKTIKEWFGMLPKEIRDKAIVNATVYHLPESIDNLTEQSLEDAIFNSFDWHSSKEGFFFWEEVYEKVQKG